MPRVPYQPYSEVAPGDVAVNIPTSPEAFGVGVARATEGLGGAVEKAGDTLFNRAIAMQDLTNETEGKQGDLKLMGTLGDLHSRFNALEGEARVRAFPKYKQDVFDAYNNIRGSLSNDDSRRKFDGAAMSTIGRTIFNAAGSTATAHRQWVAGTSAAQMELDSKFLEGNSSESAYEEAAARTRENAKTLAASHDFEPGGPQEQLIEKKAISKLRRGQIYGVSKANKPEEAEELLNKHRADLSEDDFNFLQGAIQTQSRSTGAANIANTVYAPGKQLDQMKEEGRKLWIAQHGTNDSVGMDHTMKAIESRWRGARFDIKTQQDVNWDTVQDGIAKGVKDINDLRAQPGMAETIDNLPAHIRNRIPASINSYNAARDRPGQVDRYKELLGMSNSVEGQKKLLDIDALKENLTQGQMDHIRAIQKQLRKDPGGDPRVRSAMSNLIDSMGPQLDALHVARFNAKHAKEYYEFRGTLQMALDDWPKNEGKGAPATYKDIVETIGPRLITSVATPGFLGRMLPEFPTYNRPGETAPFTETKTPFFHVTPPAAWVKSMKAQVLDAGGAEPTPQQLQQAYVRQLYQQRHGKSGSE